MCVCVCLCVWAPQAWKHQDFLPTRQGMVLCATTAASQHQCFPKTLGKQSLFVMRFCSLWFINRTFSSQGMGPRRNKTSPNGLQI